jgi:hypothetical protein
LFGISWGRQDFLGKAKRNKYIKEVSGKEYLKSLDYDRDRRFSKKSP